MSSMVVCLELEFSFFWLSVDLWTEVCFGLQCGRGDMITDECWLQSVFSRNVQVALRCRQQLHQIDANVLYGGLLGVQKWQNTTVRRGDLLRKRSYARASAHILSPPKCSRCKKID